jgi:hypothetical protein
METTTIKRITKQEATQIIKEMFGLANENQKRRTTFTENDGNTHFMFFKGEFERDEVIGKLVNEFGRTIIEDGQIRVSPITLVYTDVYVEGRGAQQE